MIERIGHDVTVASSGAEAKTHVAATSFEIAFVDLRIGTECGLTLARQLKADYPQLVIVGMGGGISARKRLSRARAEYL
ncbi:MAG: hypothetical protein J6386_00145 [Candidatus Synoicihabitans palmerolidicus]|nr:hypothetical protein [Candidatus Synoicihabitans palmerolidicus]